MYVAGVSSALGSSVNLANTFIIQLYQDKFSRAFHTSGGLRTSKRASKSVIKSIRRGFIGFGIWAIAALAPNVSLAFTQADNVELLDTFGLCNVSGVINASQGSAFLRVESALPFGNASGSAGGSQYSAGQSISSSAITKADIAECMDTSEANISNLRQNGADSTFALDNVIGFSFTFTGTGGVMGTFGWSVGSVSFPDNVAPVISSLSANLTPSTDAGKCTANVSFTAPTAMDNVDGAITPVLVSSPTAGLVSGSDFPLGVTTMTYTATDASINASMASFTITVSDGEAPVFSGVFANLTPSTDAGKDTANVTFAAPTVVDNVDGTLTPVLVSSPTAGLVSGSDFPLGDTTMTYTATDAAANASMASFTITVSDGEAPVIAGVSTNLTPSTDASKDTANVSFTAPSAVDNVDGAITPVLVSSPTAGLVSGSDFPLGVTTMTYTATDASTNASMASFTITVSDDEAPVLAGMPTNITKSTDAGLGTAVVNFTPPTASDIVDGAITPTIVSSPKSGLTNGSAFPIGVTTLTYTATDAAGNKQDASFTITVIDDEKPVISAVSDRSYQVAAGATSVDVDLSSLGITATDNQPSFTPTLEFFVNGSLSQASNPHTFDLGQNTVVVTTKDDAGNVSDPVSFKIVIVDAETFTFALQQTVTIPLDATGLVTLGIDNIGATLVFDEGVGISNVITTPNSLNCGDIGPAVSVAMTIVDDTVIGYSLSRTTNVDVVDSTPPTIGALAAVDIQLDNAGTASVVASQLNANVTDACGLASFALTSSGSFTTADLGSNTVSVSATDIYGNMATGSRTVNVVDDIAPVVVTKNAAVTLSDAGVASITAAQINNGSTDNTGIASISVSPSSFNQSDIGSKTVTLTVTDTSGNSDTATATVTVKAPTPKITGIQPGSNLQLGFQYSMSISGTGFVAPMAITYGPNGTGHTCTGPTVISWTYMTCTMAPVTSYGSQRFIASSNGYSGPVSTVTVDFPAPNAAPVANAGPDQDTVVSGSTVTLDASGSTDNDGSIVSYTWTRTGGTGGAITLSDATAQKPTFIADTLLGNATPVTHIFSLTAKDEDGATSTPSTVTITVQPPVTFTLNLPLAVTVPLEATGVVVFDKDNIGATIVLDAGVGISSITFSPTSVNCGNVGTPVPVSMTAVGDTVARYTTSAVTNVSAVDTTPPVIGAIAALDVQLNSTGTASVTAGQINGNTTDACGIASFALTSSGAFTGADLGANTVSVSAADNNGNTATGSRTVNVIDSIDPVAISKDVSVTLDAGGTASITAAQVNNGSSDNAGIASISVSPSSFAGADLGANTVTLTVTDTSGNSNTATATVTVTDVIKPVITPPTDIAQNTDAGLNTAAVTFASSATDNSGDIIALVYKLGTTVITSPHVFAKGESTVTIDGEDSAGNTATQVSFKVTVSDAEKPVITPPADIAQNTDAGLNTTALNVTGLGSVIDNSGGTISITYMIGTTVLTGSYNFAVGETTVTMDAVDAEGNNANQVSFTVTVSDGEGPVITPPADQIVNTDAGTHTAAVDMTGLGSVVDNSGGSAAIIYKIGAIILTGSYNFAVGQTTVTMDATDAIGNHATQASFKVTVLDATNPVVALSSGTTVITGPETFDVNVVFSESVTGFVAADISAMNGQIMGLTGSGTTYFATVKATGLGKVSLTIPASVAVDIAGNGNIKSDTLRIEVSIVEDTQQMIAKFQNARATQLISNQPNLTGFLSGERSRGAFKLSLTEGRGTFNFVAAQNDNKRFWYRIGGSMTKDGTSDTSYLFGVIGSHFAVTPSLLIGGLLEFDHLKQDDGASLIEGRGWLAGPYFVTKLAEQPAYIDGRLLYGQTTNDISPLGTFTDRFETERVLAQLKVSGALEFGKSTLRPSAQASYTSDQQKSYIDGFGSVIPEQGIELFEGAFGLEINHSVPLASASKNLDLTAGLTAIYSSTSGYGNPSTAAASTDGGRARVDFGLHYNTGKGTQFSVDSYLDGVGASDFEGYGLNLGFNVNF